MDCTTKQCRNGTAVAVLRHHRDRMVILTTDPFDYILN